tara:strand:+ start:241 stop:600 length:360 start_codon:yes stop_codon:yes gene_type:complete
MVEVLFDHHSQHHNDKMSGVIAPEEIRRSLKSMLGDKVISSRVRKEVETSLLNKHANLDFRTLVVMISCFQKWRPLKDLDVEDGYQMGRLLMAGRLASEASEPCMKTRIQTLWLHPLLN